MLLSPPHGNPIDPPPGSTNWQVPVGIGMEVLSFSGGGLSLSTQASLVPDESSRAQGQFLLHSDPAALPSEHLDGFSAAAATVIRS